MTYLEHWTNQFPSFMEKATQWEKDLLSRQDPRKVAIYDERGLRNLLVLLKDFEVKAKEGKLTESMMFKQVDKDLQRYSDSNLAKNGFAQAGATSLITAGASMITTPGYRVFSAVTIALGIGIGLIGRFSWGIKKTQRKVWDTITKKFNLPESPEMRATSIISAKRIIRMLILAPACSIVAIVTGIFAADVTGTHFGYVCSGVGLAIGLVDIIVITIISKD